MSDAEHSLTIGEVADRTGLRVSAIRFYESNDLISSTRATSGHRRFERSAIRRLSFIRTCQKLGYSLEQIRQHLGQLPDARTPTEEDWSKLAKTFIKDIEARIEALQLLADKVSGCIGCGCLSLKACAIWNPEDAAADHGSGPRWLLGDSPSQGEQYIDPE